MLFPCLPLSCFGNWISHFSLPLILNICGLTTLLRVIILENLKGLIQYVTLAKQRSNIEQTVLGDFYSECTVSFHPRIPSWISHCTVKLKQLWELIFEVNQNNLNKSWLIKMSFAFQILGLVCIQLLNLVWCVTADWLVKLWCCWLLESSSVCFWLIWIH